MLNNLCRSLLMMGTLSECLYSGLAIRDESTLLISLFDIITEYLGSSSFIVVLARHAIGVNREVQNFLACLRIIG